MSATKKDPSGLVIGGEPRIDFLPPEIKAGKQARQTRRSLLALGVIVVAVCVAGYVFAAGLAALAQGSLATAQERTQELLKEQGEYSEVRTVSAQISATESARLVGSATEVLWKEYLTELVSALPEGVSIEKYGVVSQDATELAPVPSVLLQNSRISTISFSARIPALAQAEATLVSLKSLPGYADAWVTPIQVAPDGTYTADFTLNVNSDVLERRFFTVKSETSDDTDGDAASSSVSDTETPAKEVD